MTSLTDDERRTVFLALEEYAAGFAMTLSDQDCAHARELAQRILRARSLELRD
ncbi:MULTISPECIES: hypothetical protein [Brevibacterium]|jgi:hypothetical protein|uniref:Uncharacterized protein n=1 Tax=Brevibacterium salitolerans TaxID=1403566 RepID=A0ABN2WG04_9MICO|nr:hypothetical protein [Brevibacterium sp.]